MSALRDPAQLRGGERRGLSLVEMMIVLAIIATLAGIAVPRYRYAIESARITVAVDEIKNLQAAIDFYEQAMGQLPARLDDLGDGPYLDPWGEPYQYLDFSTVKGKGEFRKDKFLVPLNTTYDLYSMGPDGKSTPPLTAKASRDDIVRANNGDFVGTAEDY